MVKAEKKRTTWNYRHTVVTEGDTKVYALREVYYREGKVWNWSEPVVLGGYESETDLSEDLIRMAKSSELGLLDLDKERENG